MMCVRCDVIRNSLVTLQTDAISLRELGELLVWIGTVHRMAGDTRQLALLKTG
jgi:hypothetical protein